MSVRTLDNVLDQIDDQTQRLLGLAQLSTEAHDGSAAELGVELGDLCRRLQALGDDLQQRSPAVRGWSPSALADLAERNALAELDDPAGLVVTMAHVAETLHEQAELEGLLRTVVLSARDTVPGVDAASVAAQARPGCMATVAATGPLAFEMSELEHGRQEGPGFRAGSDELGCSSGRLSQDVRWPAYGSQAGRLGIESQLSLPLSDDVGGPLTLNLYARAPEAFDSPAVRQLAQLFAVHARHAVRSVTSEARLAEALDARKVISQAVGIVMERYQLTEQQAFALLAHAAEDAAADAGHGSPAGVSSVAARLVADLEAKTRLAAARLPR